MPGHGRPACLTCQSPLPTVRSTVHQRWYTDTGSPPRARPGPTRPCTPAGRRDRRGVRGGCPAVPWWGGGAHRHRVRACMTVLGTAKSQQRRRGRRPTGPTPRHRPVTIVAVWGPAPGIIGRSSADARLGPRARVCPEDLFLAAFVAGPHPLSADVAAA